MARRTTGGVDSPENAPITVRGVKMWLTIVLALAGILFGAGGSSVAINMTLSDLKSRVAMHDTSIRTIEVTQAEVLVELRHMNEQLATLNRRLYAKNPSNVAQPERDYDGE